MGGAVVQKSFNLLIPTSFLLMFAYLRNPLPKDIAEEPQGQNQ